MVFLACRIFKKMIHINLFTKRSHGYGNKLMGQRSSSCWSVAKSCLTLCDPMDWSAPGFPVLHYLPELLKFMFMESVMLSNHLILCRPLLLLPSIFPASGSFPMSRLFASGGQVIGVSASTSVLPTKEQYFLRIT